MHSSRVRTTRSSSRGVCLSECRDTLPTRVWAWTLPLGVGLETPPPGQTPQALPWVWAWKPARHARIPSPACGQTDTSGGSRISPRRGRQLPRGGRQHTILPKFLKNCMKLKEFGPWGGARVQNFTM